jgi:outer membrane receptor protein involved in Fe transport
MSSLRGAAGVRPLTLLSALLMSAAFTAPAFAQIETVVVTAEKKAEDVQSVPIAVSAYSAQDLAAHQIQQFKDLQFSTPNVSFTKTNFTGADFQIRGIGIAAVAGSAESGVAVHEDDVFLANPPLTESNFYDLDRVEVLRGPQSTLYGRGATGGTVNIITAKPDLDNLAGSGEVSYGNYNQTELKGMVNIPIIDGELGARIAGDWTQHGGFVTNVADGHKDDSQNIQSIRASIRWQPSSDTTIDVIGSFSNEADRKLRAQKQLCTFDPTGVLGCLPDSAGTGTLNVNAQFTGGVASKQAMADVGNSIGGPGLAALFSNLGLFDLSQSPPARPANANPSNLRQINTDFNPVYRAQEKFVALNVKQTINDWLGATLVAGYEDHSTFSQESYNNVGPTPLNQAQLTTAENTLAFILSGGIPALGPNFNPAYYAHYAPFFTSHPGQLPLSSFKNIGLTSGNIAYYSPNQAVIDQSDGYSKQYSGELRFNSNFQGPLNFMLAGYYLTTNGYGDYYVNGNVIDYPGIVLGSILGALTAPGLCEATGCIDAPSYYHNIGRNLNLTSKAVFGEVYYDILDDLKLTLGARFTEDQKSENDRIAFLSGLIPLGTTNETTALNALVTQHQVNFDASRPGTFNDYEQPKATFDKFTGRALLSYSPKLDFTDQTMIYASYSRGYKAGGFNPGLQPNLAGTLPAVYKPEGIDALEVGTKNTLLDGTLQANLTAWYYNYEGLQVSSIVANTSINQNINAHLWGLEGEWVWQPNDALQMDINFGYTNSQIGNIFEVDPRNPSAGRTDTVLIKDATPTSGAGQNCVLYMINGQTLAPGDNPAFQAAIPGLFFDPPGGTHADAAHGVANANYGSCATASGGGIPDAVLHAFGYSRTDPLLGGTGDNSGGVAVSLHGKQLQNTPPFNISVGMQYTFNLDQGYTLVPRVDYYWQSDMWGRIFNDPSDRINSWSVANAQITLNSADSVWYIQGFVKNIFNSNNITGEYLTSSSSALYTNAFLEDPRTFGFRLGAHF